MFVLQILRLVDVVLDDDTNQAIFRVASMIRKQNTKNV